MLKVFKSPWFYLLIFLPAVYVGVYLFFSEIVNPIDLYNRLTDTIFRDYLIIVFIVLTEKMMALLFIFLGLFFGLLFVLDLIHKTKARYLFLSLLVIILMWSVIFVVVPELLCMLISPHYLGYWSGFNPSCTLVGP